MVVVKRPEAQRHKFAPAPDIDFPRFLEWNVVLPESLKSCQHYFEVCEKLSGRRHFGGKRRGVPAGRVRPSITSGTPSGFGLCLTEMTYDGCNRSLHSNCRIGEIYGRGGGVGRALGVR